MNRIWALLSLTALLALGVAAPAAAQPVLNLYAHHVPTNAVPGGSPGEAEVTTLTAGSAGGDEVQRVNVYATTGAFRLSFEGETTTALDFDASPGEVQSALRGLSSIGSPNVDVGGGLNFSGYFSYTVTFTGALAETDVPLLVGSQGSPRLGVWPELWLDVENMGDTATSGPVTLTVTLPTGLRRHQVRNATITDDTVWSCPGAEGEATIVCTTSDPIARHNNSRGLAIGLTVDPGLPLGIDRFVRATLKGGGSPDAPAAAGCAAGEASCAIHRVHVDDSPAGFGIVADSFEPDFFALDGMDPVRQAGSHPEQLIVPFDFHTVDTPSTSNLYEKAEDESIRNLAVDLPPGFVGNPTAVGECPAAGLILNICPGASQVGIGYVRTASPIQSPGPNHTFEAWHRPIYNMVHPTGSIVDLAFVVAGNPVHVKAELNPANSYAIRSTVSDINETVPPYLQRVTLWGTPADDSHDSERCGQGSSVAGGYDTSEECPTDIAERPFLTVPAQCEEETSFRLHSYDSWQDVGAFGPAIEHTLPGEFEGCEKPRFDPSISLRPTGDEAGTPTGLDVTVRVPQNDSPHALATPPVKSTTVTLPEGMAVNPAFSDGLETCSESEIGLGTNRRVRCPDNSRLGELELSTPLLPKPLEGSLYLAEQKDNPFGSLLAFYMEMRDNEDRGILVKVPGEVVLDRKTGQITSNFDDLPQLPFEEVTLKFRSGSRAPLVNPPTCGEHEIEAKIASYAQPDEEVDATNTYELDEGPGGADCVSSLSRRPFDPSLIAGSVTPVAGAFTQMHLRVNRSDSDQEFSTVQGAAPLGLTASLIGVARCSEAQIAQAERRDDPGDGHKEQDDPSCPVASQVGTVDTGAGAGPSPIYVPGKVYLAGPYKGAPISGVAIVPAVAGPVDVGTVVVRAPAYLDPRTAQLRIASDELPQVVNGVLVRVKDVRIRLDRPNFVINPTNCSEQQIFANLFSTEGKSKALFNRFQVGECASLDFNPRINLRLKGGVKRGAHPALTAVVRPRPGHANFSRAVVTLPNSAFLDQAHIRTICTRVQFAAGPGNGALCPPGAVYGTARAYSPLVEGAFEGPVFLRSSDNKLPDMVVALKGPPNLPIDFELSSRIDSFKGGIRSTFEGIPDVPVSRFVLEMQGGKKGLIVNSRHLCFKAKRNRAKARLVGQNNRRSTPKPIVRSVQCAKKRKKAKAKAAKRRARAKRLAARNG